MTKRQKFLMMARAFKAACLHPVAFAKFAIPFGESSMSDYVARTYGFPDGLPVLDLLDLFPAFNEDVRPFAFLEGGSSPIDLALLKALARRYEECRYFEIGAWRGESLANVASVAKEGISLSLSDEGMRQAGWGDRHLATSKYFSRDLKNVVHIGHDSRTFDYTRYLGTCDLVFIDGDHSYD